MRRNKYWKAIVTFGGLGYSPFAPGTMGAFGALIPALLIIHFAPYPYFWLLLLIILGTVLGIIGADKLVAEWGNDPQKIVIDEATGMWISLLWVGTNWITMLAAFILFRFFDIVKPLGIRKSEELSGGIGVMTDDIIAGIYSNLILQIALILLPDVFLTLSMK